MTAPVPGRGCAWGGYDNNGTLDVVVSTINAMPQLLRCDSTLSRNWIKIRTVDVRQAAPESAPASKSPHSPEPRPRPTNHSVQIDEVPVPAAATSHRTTSASTSASTRLKPSTANPLALRPDRLLQKPRRQPPLRHPGRRQDPRVKHFPHRQRKSSREEVGSMMMLAPSSNPEVDRMMWLTLLAISLPNCPNAIGRSLSGNNLRGKSTGWSESSPSVRQRRLGNVGTTRNGMNGLCCYPVQRACVSRRRRSPRLISQRFYVYTCAHAAWG